MTSTGNSGKRKGSESRPTQLSMGPFLSKSKNSDKKKRKRRTQKMSSFIWTRGSYLDTEEYRNNYPGKKDHPDWNDNYDFYMNQIPSKPDGDFIDKIHSTWWEDHARLERHHGYIQWLFPIRDSGMNWHAQELQCHEIDGLKAEEKAMKRLLKSYEMMLNFYGMKLVDQKDGTIERADNWRDRFHHLNRSYHNYLRITRILKCLGEFDFEHLKANFVKFVLYEGLVKGTLHNTIDSCMKYWVGVIRSDEQREDILNFYDEVCEKDQEIDEDSEEEQKKLPTKKKGETVKQTNTLRGKVSKAQSQDSDMSEDDTLGYATNLIDSENDSSKKPRKTHEMSESEEDVTNDANESQEMNYWKTESSTAANSVEDFSNGKDKEETNKDVDIDNSTDIQRDVSEDNKMGEEKPESAILNVSESVVGTTDATNGELQNRKVENDEKELKKKVEKPEDPILNASDGVEETIDATDGELQNKNVENDETELNTKGGKTEYAIQNASESVEEETMDATESELQNKKVENDEKELSRITDQEEQSGAEMDIQDDTALKEHIPDGINTETTKKPKKIKLDGTEDEEKMDIDNE